MKNILYKLGLLVRPETKKRNQLLTEINSCQSQDDLFNIEKKIIKHLNENQAYNEYKLFIDAFTVKHRLINKR